METFLKGRVVLHPGDNRESLKLLADNSIDSVVTDPPYALVSIGKRYGKSNMHEPAGTKPHGSPHYQRLAKGFMGKDWDTGETAFAVEFWAEILRALKPGGHVVAFSGTRTYHRMVVAVEDAGFEIRDQLAWIYGSGFPKSHDVSKGIDRAAGVERKIISEVPAFGIGGNGVLNGHSDGATMKTTKPESKDAIKWSGWGTALKPSWEPICLARKPLIGTVVANVLEHGTGAINVDGCRVGNDGGTRKSNPQPNSVTVSAYGNGLNGGGVEEIEAGRWPANILHDDSPEATLGMGEASRYFYSAKAGGDDRLGSKHPTVKPVDLMQWLCRLITPPGGTILDPFSGTGSTGEAAFREGFNAILMEREEEYCADIRKRMALVLGSVSSRKRAASKKSPEPTKIGGLFEEFE